MFEDALDLYKPRPKRHTQPDIPEGKQILIDAAVYLTRTRTTESDDDWFKNTQDFPSGHVISKEDAGYYEALHILNCLANDRELCFNNVQVSQAWVDEAVEAYMQEIDPIPRNLSIKKSMVAAADGPLVDDLEIEW